MEATTEQMEATGAGRRRQVSRRPFPADRRLVTAAMRAGRRSAPMYGLMDLDVTEAKRILASRRPPSSLTAFVVASVARAAAAHPEVHAYRDWRGRVVTHRHVDVSTMVEIQTPQGPFGLPHVLRDADVRDVADLTVGGMSARPRAIDGDVRIRDVLDISLVIDHNIVDGAPAARFASEFRGLMESASVLD